MLLAATKRHLAYGVPSEWTSQQGFNRRSNKISDVRPAEADAARAQALRELAGALRLGDDVPPSQVLHRFVGMIPTLRADDFVEQDNQLLAVAFARAIHQGETKSAAGANSSSMTTRNALAATIANMATQVERIPHKHGKSSRRAQSRNPAHRFLKHRGAAASVMIPGPNLLVAPIFLPLVAKGLGARAIKPPEEKTSSKAMKFLSEVLETIPPGQVADETFLATLDAVIALGGSDSKRNSKIIGLLSKLATSEQAGMLTEAGTRQVVEGETEAGPGSPDML